MENIGKETSHMTELSINVESHKRVELVTVNGRIDSNSAPQFDKALKDIMEGGRHNIVLNLAEVNYMSSAGLRGMVSALRECKKNRGDVRIAAASERVNEVLELAGLDSLFQLFESSTAAVGSF
jgi:anti-anti-sigma factor